MALSVSVNGADEKTRAFNANTGAHPSEEALRIIAKSVNTMINIASKESAKDAFACDRPTVLPSLVDKPKQRLEWLMLSTLVPILAVSSMAGVHGEVVRALQILRQALYLSDLPGRVKGFSRAILGMLGGKQPLGLVTMLRRQRKC